MKKATGVCVDERRNVAWRGGGANSWNMISQIFSVTGMFHLVSRHFKSDIRVSDLCGV